MSIPNTSSVSVTVLWVKQAAGVQLLHLVSGPELQVDISAEIVNKNRKKTANKNGFWYE